MRRLLAVIAVVLLIVTFTRCAGEELAVVEVDGTAVTVEVTGVTVELLDLIALNAATEAILHDQQIAQLERVDTLLATVEAYYAEPTAIVIPIEDLLVIPYDMTHADVMQLIELNAYVKAETGTSCLIGTRTAINIVDYLASPEVMFTLDSLSDLLAVPFVGITKLRCLEPYTVQKLAQ